MAFRFRRAPRRADHAARRVDPGLRAEIDVVERVRSWYPAGTRLSFGAPTRCPRCAEFGLVEEVDIMAGRAANRCLSCGCRWEITVRALLAVDGPRLARTAGASAPVAALRRRRAVESRLAPDDQLEGVLFTRSDAGEVVRRPVRAANRPLWSPGPAGARPPWDVPGLPLRVLLVEDDPRGVQVVRSLVEPAGPQVIDLRTATTRAAGEVAARVSPPDVVMLGLCLPDSRGVATVRGWRERGGRSPVLVVGDGTAPEVEADCEALGVAGVVGRADLADLAERGVAGTAAFVDLLRGASVPGAGPEPGGARTPPPVRQTGQPCASAPPPEPRSSSSSPSTTGAPC